MCSIVDTIGIVKSVVPIAVVISKKSYVRFWNVVENGGGANGGKPWPIEPEMFCIVFAFYNIHIYQRVRNTFLILLSENIVNIFSQYIYILISWNKKQTTAIFMDMKRKWFCLFVSTFNDFFDSYSKERITHDKY